MIRSLQLAAAHFRFVGQDVIRDRRLFYAVVIGGLATLAAFVSAGSAAGNGQRLAPLYMIGLLTLPGPLARSWVADDVRLGYAAWWLQKAARALDIYLGRLLAVIAWAALATLALTASFSIAVAVGGHDPGVALDFLVGFGWFPTLVVVLAFLGSALGARNAALPAYGAVLASAGLHGAGDLLELGRLFDPLRLLLPPYRDVVDTVTLMASHGRAAAVPLILPVYGYIAVCAGLGVALALRVPRRLAAAG